MFSSSARKYRSPARRPSPTPEAEDEEIDWSGDAQRLSLPADEESWLPATPRTMPRHTKHEVWALFFEGLPFPEDEEDQGEEGRTHQTSTSKAGRSTRTPFTASDRKKIFNIMWAVAGLQMERYAGNTAFQILEQKYPWHSWHSWRDHWLRQMQPYLAGIFDELLPQDSPMPEDEEALELATEIGHHLLGLLKPARVSPSMEYPTPKNSSTRLAPRLYLKEIVRTPEGWKSRKLSDMAARTPIKVSGPPPRAYSVASDSDSEPEEVAWNPDPKRRLSYGVERTAKKRVREISPVREDWDQDWTGGEFDFLREPEVSRWTQETPSSNPFTAPSLVEKSTSPKGKEKDRYIEGWEPESDLELQDSAESYVVDSAEETE